MTESVEVVVGVIGRAHGIHGEVAVAVRTDEPARRLAPGARLRVENDPRRFTVVRTRDHSGRLLAVFAELADRTAAEAARGLVLVVDVDAAERPADAEEFYDRQLIGLRAFSAAGVEIGPVTAVVHLPVQDSLEIRTAAGPRLVPFVTALVPTIDVDRGRLVVADVAGLLADEDG